MKAEEGLMKDQQPTANSQQPAADSQQLIFLIDVLAYGSSMTEITKSSPASLINIHRSKSASMQTSLLAHSSW